MFVVIVVAVANDVVVDYDFVVANDVVVDCDFVVATIAFNCVLFLLLLLLILIIV